MVKCVPVIAEGVESVMSLVRSLRGHAARTAQKCRGLFSVTVNYDQTVEEMVQAGQYDSATSVINSENFSVSGQGQAVLEVRLVSFDRWPGSEEIVRQLCDKGSRPIELSELLAFSAAHRDEQRKFSIVALGSVGQAQSGRPFVPFLSGDANKRMLELAWFDGPWSMLSHEWRFAAVSK